MVVYEFYCFNPEKGFELIGILPERRKNPKRITEESVMNWGRFLLDDNAKSENIFFKRKTVYK